MQTQSLDWPNRVVRFIVPFAAGGPTDIVARVVTEQLSKIWGQQVVIENKGAADPHGNVYFTRRRVNEAFLEGLLEEFHKNGAQIIHRAGQENPATFLKVLAQLVPREVSVEHSASILGKLSDEQLAAMISELDRQIAELASGENSKIIDARAEPTPERGATEGNGLLVVVAVARRAMNVDPTPTPPF